MSWLTSFPCNSSLILTSPFKKIFLIYIIPQISRKGKKKANNEPTPAPVTVVENGSIAKVEEDGKVMVTMPDGSVSAPESSEAENQTTETAENPAEN